MKESASEIILPKMTIDYQSASFPLYLNSIIHTWLKTLTSLAIILIPMFLFLDLILTPGEILWKFVLYRSVSTLLVVIQFYIIQHTRAGISSYVHGYLFTLNVGISIAQMTVELGGFDSSYYAGLNLIIIGVNLLLPWRFVHSILTSLMIISSYVVLNLINPHTFDFQSLINNLFFLFSTAIMAVSINYVKYKLIQQEYVLRTQILETNSKLEESQIALRDARDSLWSEISLAKEIQTALLPKNYENNNYQIAGTMLPASEVGGDYLDVKDGTNGTTWFNIGDVSGHGVTSGLIMMMAQTSIASLIQGIHDVEPSEVLCKLNIILSENIQRLNEFKYMTLTLLRADARGKFVYSGKHQDLLIYHHESKTVEEVETEGTWIGVIPDMTIPTALLQGDFTLYSGDVLLLYTDGVTEAQNMSGDYFGNERLVNLLKKYGERSATEIEDIIMREVLDFIYIQDDDITLLVVKRK